MIQKLIEGFFHNFGFAMVVLAVAIAAIRSLCGKPWAEELLRWSLLLPSGLNGLYTAAAHILIPEFCAEQIGWPDSPFQFEVGIADLTIGVLGVMAFWGNLSFRFAATIASILWYGGDAIGHVYQMIVAQNFAPGNAGSWFWMDAVLPPILIVSFLAYWQKSKQAP